MKVMILSGPHSGVVATLMSVREDDWGKRYYNVKLPNYTRCDFNADQVRFLQKEEKVVRKSTYIDTSMFFADRGVSRNMSAARNDVSEKPLHKDNNVNYSNIIMNCSECGMEYDRSEREGMDGKISHCPSCAQSDVVKYTGVNIYSHKTAPDVEIKQAGKLIKNANTFKYK